MHAYDVPRRQSYQPIPAMRSAQDPPGSPSVTPIYDALYAEWNRSFRALPGDRHGEEELGFTAFGISPHLGGAYGSYSTGTYSMNTYSSDSYPPGTYSPGAYDGRHGTAAYATGRLAAQHGTRREQSGHPPQAASVWQPVGRMPTGHTGTHQFSAAALPPGPRRGH
ncbi:hypothetical protein GCM10010145_28650 [Streptomyces ruber]|uniref:Uncharacterized protein n=2 Tax=Streptomyces TaxID=1883 RepID=A0A918BCM5_9ACTN|nr:hypothetical protein [Streptomyces ruber]GGQ57100.1 hypothetical protein GCM10010145_28650 [Streptomyces ruber]